MSARDLDRFKTAQDDRGSGFKSALHELTLGRKRGHWIWYIFPQLSGLGSSAHSERYGIAGREEALAYVRDPVLGDRLLKATSTVADQLRQGVLLPDLMGSRIDALKLVSSLTLFEQVAGDSLVGRAATEVLEAAEKQGFRRCRLTLDSGL